MEKIKNGIKTRILKFSDYGQTRIFLDLEGIPEERIILKEKEKIGEFNKEAVKKIEEIKFIDIDLQTFDDKTCLKYLRNVARCEIMPQAKKEDVIKVINIMNEVSSFIGDIIKKERTKRNELFDFVKNNLN